MPEPGFFVVAKDIHYVTFSRKEEVEDDCMFSGCSCNSILDLTEEGSGHALFNPTTLEYKILPETIVESHLNHLEWGFTIDPKITNCCILYKP